LRIDKHPEVEIIVEYAFDGDQVILKFKKSNVVLFTPISIDFNNYFDLCELRIIFLNKVPTKWKVQAYQDINTNKETLDYYEQNDKNFYYRQKSGTYTFDFYIDNSIIETRKGIEITKNNNNSILISLYKGQYINFLNDLKDFDIKCEKDTIDHYLSIESKIFKAYCYCLQKKIENALQKIDEIENDFKKYECNATALDSNVAFLYYWVCGKLYYNKSENKKAKKYFDMAKQLKERTLGRSYNLFLKEEFNEDYKVILDKCY